MTYNVAAQLIWGPIARHWPSALCRKMIEHRDEKKPENDGPTRLRRLQSVVEGIMKPIAWWITPEDHARLVGVAVKRKRPRKPCGHKGGCSCYVKRETVVGDTE